MLFEYLTSVLLENLWILLRRYIFKARKSFCTALGCFSIFRVFFPSMLKIAQLGSYLHLWCTIIVVRDPEVRTAHPFIPLYVPVRGLWGLWGNEWLLVSIAWYVVRCRWWMGGVCPPPKTAIVVTRRCPVAWCDGSTVRGLLLLLLRLWLWWVMGVVGVRLVSLRRLNKFENNTLVGRISYETVSTSWKDHWSLKPLIFGDFLFSKVMTLGKNILGIYLCRWFYRNP